MDESLGEGPPWEFLEKVAVDFVPGIRGDRPCDPQGCASEARGLIEFGEMDAVFFGCRE